MKKLVFALLLVLCFSHLGFCDGVSLIDEDQVNLQANFVNEYEDEGQDDVVQQNQEDSQNDQFQQMNEFINLENEKIKDIKLLNLDLQKADLQLKKKEIEQKISQISKGDMVSSSVKNVSVDDEAVSDFPSLKLVSVFVSDSDKKAILNVNGVNKNVIQGQKFDSFAVETIVQDKVVIKFDNGETQELFFS